MNKRFKYSYIILFESGDVLCKSCRLINELRNSIMRKVSLLFVSIVLLSQFAVAAGYPLNGTWELMDPDSWSFQFRQKNAPEGFVCGYVVDDAWGNNYFSMYVVKKGNKYELIYKKTGIVKTKEIDGVLAKELLKTVDGNIGEAQKRRDFEIEEAKKRIEKKEVDETEGVEDIWVVFYDGDVIYALKPGKMAYSWPDVFYRLPDKNWNDQYNILSDVKTSDNPDIKVEYIDEARNISPDTIFRVTEVSPEFPGGMQALMDYLNANVNYPADCREAQIQGRVLVSFVVEKDGSIKNATVVKGVHPLLDAEARRVISAMPNWKPGMQHGTPANVEFTIPVNFRLNKSVYYP